MPERRYTLSEIDRMRAGIRARNQNRPDISFFISFGSGPPRMTPESEASLERFNRECEDQLRTAMLAGVDPDEFPPIDSSDRR